MKNQVKWLIGLILATILFSVAMAWEFQCSENCLGGCWCYGNVFAHGAGCCGACYHEHSTQGFIQLSCCSGECLYPPQY